MTMQYKEYRQILYDVIPEDVLTKAQFSGVLETEGEHNWRVVLLRKTDMAYAGSANVNLDKSWVVYMEPYGYDDESLVAMCFDNNGVYNADILDNVSLCSVTFYADVPKWTAKLESTWAKTTIQDFIKPTQVRTKSELPWFYAERLETIDYTESDDYFTFVFDEEGKGHFELNEVPIAPPPQGAILGIPGRDNALKITGITAIDGSDSSVDAESIIPKADIGWELPSTGLTHDIFGDGTCIASGTFKNFNLSMQGGYNMEFYNDTEIPYPEGGYKEVVTDGSYNYLGSDYARLIGYNSRLRLSWSLPAGEGKITISWTMYWANRGNDYIDLFTIDNALRVYIYNSVLYVKTYTLGALSAADSGTILTNTTANFSLSVDDDGNRVRLYQNGVLVFSSAASDMSVGYTGKWAKHTLYIGGQTYEPGYRDIRLADFRFFVNRAVALSADALAMYNDTLTPTAKAVYQIKKVTGLEQDLLKNYYPSLLNVNSAFSIDSDFSDFAPLRGSSPPDITLDSATYPIDELYSTHTVSASDVDEDQTNFPLTIRVNNREAPHLFKKGRDSWKYWHIKQGATQLQAEMVEFKTAERDPTLQPVISVRILCLNNFYGSGNYIGVRRITFYDENNVAIPYDASWVCEASSTSSATYSPYRAFDTSTVTGSSSNAGWRSANGAGTWVELIVTFPAALYIKSFRVYNWHSSGVGSEWGMHAVVLHSLQTGKFVVGEDPPEEAQLFYVGSIGRHSDANDSYNHIVPLDKSPMEARCVKLKCVNNWGSSTVMGFRNISFYYKGIKVPYDTSWICQASSYYNDSTPGNTDYLPVHAFDDSSNTGTSPNSAWLGRSSYRTNQTLMVTFPEPIKFDEIRYVNYHSSGGSTTGGVRDINILVNTDKDYIFPLDFYDDGDQDTVKILQFNFLPNDDHNYATQTPAGLLWSDNWKNKWKLPRYLEAIITVKVPTLSSASDTVIDISDSSTDQETAGYIGLTGSTNATLVYDSTYEAVYNQQEDLNPQLDAYSKLIDSTDNNLDSVGGHVEDKSGNFDTEYFLSNKFQGFSENIIIPTPYSWGPESLDTISELSITAFVSQEEAVIGGSVFSLGSHILSLENVNSSEWGINVNGTNLTNAKTPIVLDQPTLLTIAKTANSYSLIVGDTLAGTDINNSSAKIANAQKGIIAKSVRFNCASTFGSSDAVGIRSIEFYYQGVLVPYNISWVFDATSEETSYIARYAFDTALPKIGSGFSNSWLSASGSPTNQVLTVTFLTQETFDEIVINNYHSTGADTDRGVDGLTIDIHSLSSFTTVWGDTLAGSQRVFDSNLTEHPATNTEDAQSPDIDTLTRLAKSVRFNFANVWYDDQYMGINNISFYKDGVKIPWDEAWVADATTNLSTAFLPRFAFDNTPAFGLLNINWISTSGNHTNQVLTITFPTALEFDEIFYHNYQGNGDGFDRGVRDATIDVHPTSSFTTVWGATLTGSQRIYDGTFTQHIYTGSQKFNCDDERMLGLSTDLSYIASNGDGTAFLGSIGKLFLSNVARSVAWNAIMEKSLLGTLVTQSETYGTTASDYVRYGFSFNNQITYAIWTGSEWKNVTSKDPAIHGNVGDTDWYYREAGTTWTLSPENDKVSAFALAVNETTNRMTKTVVDALTTPDWESTSGFAHDGYFDIVTSLYQSSTVTSQVKDISITHSDKVWVSEPIDLEIYHEVISSSLVEWVFTWKSNEDYETDQAFYEANVTCYAIVTGGDWIEVTNGDAIPGITLAMSTTGKILQFKFEFTKDVIYSESLEPVLEWKIITI